MLGAPQAENILNVGELPQAENFRNVGAQTKKIRNVGSAAGGKYFECGSAAGEKISECRSCHRRKIIDWGERTGGANL